MKKKEELTSKVKEVEIISHEIDKKLIIDMFESLVILKSATSIGRYDQQ